MKRRYVMRQVVERFRDADKIERDRLACGHVVIATRAQLSTGRVIYLAPDRRRCTECASEQDIAKLLMR